MNAILYCLLLLASPAIERSFTAQGNPGCLNIRGNTRSFLLTGNIYDKRSTSPLPGAKLCLKKSGLSTLSDENGVFNFQTSLKSDTLLISCTGYKMQEIIVHLPYNQPLVVLLSRK